MPSDVNQDDEAEIREPENSTVEDWMGQAIEQDAELAEELVEETDDLDEAEQRFEEEAEGQELHEEGYPRPDDERPAGDGPIGRPS